ncbi:MAG: hypothetical protein HGA20_14930 [Geobacteraceae bacterium]|nr:hypothetical protein [Geobacteraceae bacterium]
METIAANWKTSLAGLLGGIVTYSVTMIQSGNPWDWKAWAMGLVPVVIGFLSKDQTTTGIGYTATKVL